MFIENLVSECDATGKKYSPPVKGLHAIARGATGRWCCVMHFGPEYAQMCGYKPITHADAVRYATANEGDFVDFKHDADDQPEPTVQPTPAMNPKQRFGHW